MPREHRTYCSGEEAEADAAGGGVRIKEKRNARRRRSKSRSNYKYMPLEPGVIKYVIQYTYPIFEQIEELLGGICSVNHHCAEVTVEWVILGFMAAEKLSCATRVPFARVVLLKVAYVFANVKIRMQAAADLVCDILNCKPKNLSDAVNRKKKKISATGAVLSHNTAKSDFRTDLICSEI